ncbi:GNAT family N-acetyltransferase [Paenibacillus roseipurpureus]|uniref:GNAT family N-acetyltransferase n=1 Tax=Paenibacillus roseopurpureus TaxID=2918901 RepID=A0AA96RIM4_9BACL|nr:GNAT family N-acetyltransferase [Paenibacillus sp. MBLB1832]WNR44463.1 GNAT family N-acetyltransferase [Paenibacillus sp. MBLB1832]
MTSIIREATPQDTTAISALISQLTGKSISPLHIENRLYSMRDNPDELLYVYEEKNRILGTLSFRIKRDAEQFGQLIFSEISVMSAANDSPSAQDPRAQLEDYAVQLANKHNCAGMMWLTETGAAHPSREAQSPIGFDETGYRFVKRFI